MLSGPVLLLLPSLLTHLLISSNVKGLLSLVGATSGNNYIFFTLKSD